MVLSTWALLAAVIGIAPLRSLFGFAAPSLSSIAAALGVGVAVFALLLVHERVERTIGRVGTAEVRH